MGLNIVQTNADYLLKEQMPTLMPSDYMIEIQLLREQLAEIKRTNVRQRWRICTGLVLVNVLREKYGMLRSSKASLSESDSSSTRTCQCSEDYHRDEVQTLNRQLQEQKKVTEMVRDAAALEIERLKILLAAESGNYASLLWTIQNQQASGDPNSQIIVDLKTAISRTSMRLNDLCETDKKNRLALFDLCDIISSLSLSEERTIRRIDNLQRLDSRTQNHTMLFRNLDSRFTYCNEITTRLESRITKLEQKASLLSSLLTQCLRIMERQFHARSEANTPDSTKSLSLVETHLNGCVQYNASKVTTEERRIKEVQAPGTWVSRTHSFSPYRAETRRVLLVGLNGSHAPRFAQRSADWSSGDIIPLNPIPSVQLKPTTDSSISETVTEHTDSITLAERNPKVYKVRHYRATLTLPPPRRKDSSKYHTSSLSPSCTMPRQSVASE